MPVRNRSINNDAGPGRRGGFVSALLLVGLLPAGFVGAADADDYLKMLEAEATKVGTPATAVPTDENGSNADIGVFEDELKAHYSGTYAFYKKLPRRTQEEIYTEYSQGASIEDIRDKIYDRYLNNR